MTSHKPKPKLPTGPQTHMRSKRNVPLTSDKSGGSAGKADPRQPPSGSRAGRREGPQMARRDRRPPAPRAKHQCAVHQQGRRAHDSTGEAGAQRRRPPAARSRAPASEADGREPKVAGLGSWP
eukprot:CAMPEP_0170577848 /NCGR_PEP_ID=MMETSP0224-20130122/5144_1 /TAXON_ID=285029 /ORGANISM="Togula jolla, Strain CCCM 725" /LENGTH=122 /DNA_ID=CAMNT_0010900783 /DNA_START=237 /DNA_END=607 /DNA_ORIENTATION=+